MTIIPITWEVYHSIPFAYVGEYMVGRIDQTKSHSYQAAYLVDYSTKIFPDVDACKSWIEGKHAEYLARFVEVS